VCVCVRVRVIVVTVGQVATDGSWKVDENRP
jgi:hypothetical protein